MAVKKAKEASFKKMDSAFATSQSAIQKVKNTDPLNGNEEQEQGNENVSIDPAHYLSKKEKKEWKRLSYTAKQRYIRQAERQLKRQKKRNGIAKTEPSSVQEKEKQEKLEAAMDRLRGKFGTDVISYGAARPEKEEDPLP